MDDSEYLYANREEKYSRIIHCEMNAVLNSQTPVNGAILYTWPFLSCDRCAAHMIAAGITRVVAPALPEHLKERWDASVNKSKSYFAEANIEVVEYDIDRLDPYWS